VSIQRAGGGVHRERTLEGVDRAVAEDDHEAVARVLDDLAVVVPHAPGQCREEATPELVVDVVAVTRLPLGRRDEIAEQHGNGRGLPPARLVHTKIMPKTCTARMPSDVQRRVSVRGRRRPRPRAS